MKKLISILTAAALLLSLAACGGSETAPSTPKYDYDPNDTENMLTFLETTAAEAVTATETEVEALLSELGDSYQSYDKHKSAVADCYAQLLTRSDETYAAFQVCSRDYFKCVAAQGLGDYRTWSGALSDFYDTWSDAMSDFYDGWSDACSDIYDTCSDLISDSYNTLDYSTYSSAWSAMYEAYSEAWEALYEAYSDAWSLTYSDYSDIWAGFYEGNTDVDALLPAAEDAAEATAAVSGSKKDLKKPAAASTSATAGTSAAGTSTSGGKLDGLAAEVEQTMEGTLSALTSEWEALAVGIDSYADYMASADKIRAFYSRVNTASAQLCDALCTLGIDYAETVLASGSSADDMYDAMDDLYDLIYDDAGDDLYDSIYDGVLEDMYDVLYDGALDDRGSVAYSDWSDARSNEYDQWSDTRSDAYDQWSDFRSDMFDLWSDLRSELLWDDIDAAREVVADFREDLTRRTGQSGATQTAQAVPTAASSSGTDIDPAFKAAMDAYEAFFDEYVEFMLAFAAAEDPTALLGKGLAFLQQYEEEMTALEELGEGPLTDAEALYYTEVMLRIQQKLLEVA